MDGGRILRSQKIDEREPAKQKNTMTATENSESGMAPTDIIKAINELKTDLKDDNNTLRQEITYLGQEINGKLDRLGAEVHNLSDRVEEAESRVETVERWAAEATEALSTCLKQQRALQHKLNDLESRSRCINIRIFGMAEGEEGEELVPEFIAALLRSKLLIPDSMELNIQRAHRSGPQRPAPDKPQRAFIINFQEFATKEWALKEAWKTTRTGKLKLNNKTLYFDHDYTAEVVKTRKEYSGIKRALKLKGVCFKTLYVSMRIYWETGARVYSSAGEPREELRRRGIAVEEAMPAEGETDWGARLGELLGSRQKVTKHRGTEADVSQRVRSKLQSFQRSEPQWKGGKTKIRKHHRHEAGLQ